MLIFNKSRFPLTIGSDTVPAMGQKSVTPTQETLEIINRLVTQNQITILNDSVLDVTHNRSAYESSPQVFPANNPSKRKSSKRQNLNS